MREKERMRIDPKNLSTEKNLKAHLEKYLSLSSPLQCLTCFFNMLGVFAKFEDATQERLDGFFIVGIIFAK